MFFCWITSAAAYTCWNHKLAVVILRVGTKQRVAESINKQFQLQRGVSPELDFANGLALVENLDSATLDLCEETRLLMQATC